MNVQEMKDWIDKSSYQELLSKWRFDPVGSPWFSGEIGDYYRKIMFKKRNEVGNDASVQASKNIGWENG
jgi:hypothetical protein